MEALIKKNWKIIALTTVFNLAIILAILFAFGQFTPQAVAPPALKLSAGEDRPVNNELVVKIVEQTEPAVVSIVVKKDLPILERYYERYNPFEEFFDDDFFGRPFGFQIPRFRERGREEREIGGGSGFLVSSDGLVLTNRHVVEDQTASYVVLTNDNQRYDAKVIAKDQFLDIALLKISGRNFPHLVFGDSDRLKTGQTVIAIGNALGEFRNSVSVGVVSGLSRRIVASGGLNWSGEVGEVLEGVIQTDAAINPGNSGGPLLDLNGRVIGVNVAMAVGSENIGFALPANAVKEAVVSVQNVGEIVRPFLGIRYVQITASLRERNNLPFDYGVLVFRGAEPEDLAVIPGSPADKAGLRENDIILAIDGVEIKGDISLASLIRKKKVGDRVALRIWSRGQTKTVNVILEKFKDVG